MVVFPDLCHPCVSVWIRGSYQARMVGVADAIAEEVYASLVRPQRDVRKAHGLGCGPLRVASTFGASPCAARS